MEYSHPDNANRPENDKDMYPDDFRRSMAFKAILEHNYYKEICLWFYKGNDMELSTIASNALETYDKASRYDFDFDMMAVKEGYDFDDPTHQVYIDIAKRLHSFLNDYYSD